MKIFFRSCSALAVIAFGTLAIAQDKTAAPAAPAAPVAPMIIYDTALASGWQNWSWAKTELAIQIEGSARRPIKVEAGPWQALYLHRDAFNTTGYQNLEFLIQGTVAEGDVRINALIDGKPVNDGRVIKISNKGWTRVVTPLRTLGAEEVSIDGIWLQNATANDMPKFFVTEIKLN